MPQQLVQEFFKKCCCDEEATSCSKSNLNFIRKKELLYLEVSSTKLDFEQSIAKTRARCRVWWEQDPQVAEFRTIRVEAAEEYARLIREAVKLPTNQEYCEIIVKQLLQRFLDAEAGLNQIFLRVGSYFLMQKTGAPYYLLSRRSLIYLASKRTEFDIKSNKIWRKLSCYSEV